MQRQTPAFGIWIAAALLVCGIVRAQETRGNISGRILDSSGAVVPRATVSATNVATNVTVKTTSNAEGNYDLPFLVPGMYRVTAGGAGFKTLVRDNIEVRIHDRLQLDLTLEVGAVTEQVQVTAGAPLLETATANVGQVIDARRVAELPNQHGSPFSLMYLTPGVTSVTAFGSFTATMSQEPAGAQSGITLVNVNGAPPGTSDITMDGIPNTQAIIAGYGSGMSNSPPADLVQEVKLEQAFDASVGHTSGTVINVSLKTGSNRPHGTAYEFHREPGWNANSFFANRAGQPRGDFTYNRWGATLAGPVEIPKLYHGKDRTFFSYGYEGMRSMMMGAFTGTVPDPRNLTGDFSNLLAIGSQYQIYDPATIRPAESGRFSSQPFAGNIVPASRISPIAQSIASHYPKPNNAARPDGINNYTSQVRPEPQAYYNHLGRVDHNISDKQRLYVRAAVNRRIQGPYRNYWDDDAVGNNYVGKTRQLAVDDVYMFSPSLVMNIRYGYSRYAGGHFPRRFPFDLSKIGLSPQTVSVVDPSLMMFPQISISSIELLGRDAVDILNEDIHSLFASFTKQHRSHSLKFGADLRAYRDNLFYPGQSSGQFSFGPNFTRGPLDNSPTSPGGVGQGLASFLLGLPTGGYLEKNDSQANQSTYWSFYIHDNWRVNQRLTLDLGLRWEYEGPLTERFNRAVRGFDANAPQPIEAQAKANYALAPDPALLLDQFKVRGGLLFAGVNGVPREWWDRSLKNFAPRVGFAYDTGKHAVIRGGFGVYPIQLGVPAQNHAIQSGFNQSTPIVPTLDNGQTFNATMANPLPTGLLKAPGSSLGVQTFLGQGVSFYSPVAKTPYTMRWDLNTQTMLPAEFLLEVGYDASKSIKLQARRDQSNRDLDALPNQYLSTSPVRDQQTYDYLTENIANPFAGLLPGTGLNGRTISRSQLLRPYPQFTGVSATDYQGYSWYHALRVRVERRFANGFTSQVAYTFSKTMDAAEYLNAGDPVPHRVISTLDRPHHLAVSGIYELPVGPGKPLASDGGRLVNAIIGGWQVGTVWQVSSGEALAFGNILFVGNIRDIPLPASERTIDRWFNTSAGFETNVNKQLVSNLRTFPLRLSGVRAGTYNCWDLSLLKNTRIYEAHQFQFRAEFLNAFNHPTGFAPPNTSPTSSAFGRVTDMFSSPRTIQLGFKYVF